MRFTETKKNAIKNYLLEKIEQKEEGITKKVADNFNINQNTVHTYINELINEGIIKREKRDVYSLTGERKKYILSRKAGEIEEELYTFDKYVKPVVGEFSDNTYKIWEYAFGEMFNNVIDHSEAEKCVIIINKDAVKTSIWIADDGIGIFEHIKDFFKLKTIEDAVNELFKGKITTKKEYHSGEGIFFTSRIMDEFLIISSGKLFHVDKYDESILLDNPIKNEKGTALYMSLNNETRKNMKELFDRYSDVDGGFNRTSIALKNIYGSSPTSRSQAKRLCAGLEEFSEVELDFEGLDWMGQGFAHQLFIVFANNNPNVKLVIKGMSDDVKKMYNHVMNTK
ncbi:protein of unknown function [Eubacterium uniforme]|uniref:DUF4325 domain-containing protein n=1 Tax=Eubacterium uniforme TaxID=39495 RepID=A0A1T4VEJ5_9FIRM|nr:DUF4325 domain-containing protein [Eubacterium uniforme]SKA63308.1 protein of unknown function [Eubacterium uniforme]